MSEIRNARIDATQLGIGDHGILSASLNLSGDGWGVWFGGLALDGPPAERGQRRRPDAACGRFVAEVLRVVDVDSWESLVGSYVRVGMHLGRARRLGNITADRWLDLDAYNVVDVAAEVER